MGIPDHLTYLLKNLYAGEKQQLELNIEQHTDFKLEKEYIKAVYCHPAYLTSKQSISCEAQAEIKIARVTVYRLDVLFSQFGTSLLFHVQFLFSFLTCI